MSPASPSPSLPLPPRIPRHWLLGNLPELRSDTLGLLCRASLDHGPIARGKFGPETVCFVGTPDGAKHVLHEHAKNYTKDTPGFDALRIILGNGLFTSDGSFWLQQRRIAQPAFHKDVIASFAAAMHEETNALAKEWGNALDTGGIAVVRRNVALDMMRLTLRIVSRCLFGTTNDADAAVVGRTIPVLLELAVERVRRRGAPPMWMPTRKNRIVKAALAELDSIVYRIIRTRRADAAAGETKRDLLALLMGAKDEETGRGMTDSQLRDEVITIYLAGHETTALALSWTFFLLSRAPSIQADAVREARAAVPRDRLFTNAEVMALGLLPRIFKEALRLYPPAYSLGRRAVEARSFEGFLIPRRSLVILSPFAIHRNADVWPNPEGFDPDRFLPAAEKSRPKFAYLPFGGGPRICIGQQFAMLEASIILAVLLSGFRLDLAPGHMPTPEPVITLRPRGGMPMAISRHDSSLGGS